MSSCRQRSPRPTATTDSCEARLKEKVERITETKTRLNRLLEERRDQIASGKLQKAALLQRKWKTMQETEWQDFVVEVCRTLGAKVERVGRPGGDDANLIADFGSRRVAIMTEAKDHNVSSATIQLALAAQDQTSLRFVRRDHQSPFHGCRPGFCSSQWLHRHRHRRVPRLRFG